MLASTVQFSSNPPTNPGSPPIREAPAAGGHQRHPHRTPTIGERRVPVSSGPNSMPSNDVPPMSNHQTHVRRLRGHLTPPICPDEAGEDVVSSLERR